ncbi:MAG: ABC transporter permease [Acidobacteria bacterium]|nr:ABC transporter permease [Acidobacteriota bacterium]
MTPLRVLFARLVATVRGRPLDAALDEEIRAHLQRLEGEHRARGLSPQAAREAARREFGGVEPMKERYRDQRRFRWLDDVRRDVPYAARTLLRTPGFTAVAAMTLALGIGANGAMFSLADAVLIRPLPFDHRDRLVMLAERTPSGASTSVAPLNFSDWRDQSQSFEAMAAVVVGAAGRALTSADGLVEEVPAQAVTARFFDVFGAGPIAGRTFGADDAGERPSTVVLSEGFWRSRFGADPTLVGRGITLDGQPFTVIGIVPADFQILSDARLWTLLAERRGPEWRRTRYLRVVARLKRDVTLDQARAEMTAIASNIGRLSPETNEGWGVTVDPMWTRVIGPALRLTSLVLAGIVAFVLLMACANIANLLLARDAGRMRELAVRVAIGASRLRIVRQLLTENLVLAALGGALGLALCWTLLWNVPSILPPGTLPAGVNPSFDLRVIAFALAVTCAVGVVLGLVSALQATRRPLTETIAQGGRSGSAAADRPPREGSGRPSSSARSPRPLTPATTPPMS